MVFGTLTITPRPITLTSYTKEKTYDGLDIYDTRYTITSGSIPTYEEESIEKPFDRIEVLDTYTRFKDVYVVDSVVTGKDNILEYKFYDINTDEDVTSCYDITRIAGTLIINKAPLTIAANDHTIPYGEQKANNGLSYDGFVNGENKSVLGGKLNLISTYDYETNHNVGEYDITTSVLTSTNYDITFIKGTLTVNKAPLTLTVRPKTIVYGEARQNDGFDRTGFVFNEDVLTFNDFLSGEDVAGFSGSPIYSYTYDQSNPLMRGIGEYDITLSGITSLNYDITFIIEVVRQTQSVKANTMPEEPELVDHADPTDGDYQISFTGWDKTPAVATENTTYTALYSRDFVAADYSAVIAAQEAAAEIDRSIYTDDSLAVLDAALGEVVEGLGRTHQGEVDIMAANIDAAIGALEFKPADYTAYNAAVADLQAELQKDDYTPDSIAQVTQELADIDNALEKDLKIIDQATVDDAKAAVEALWDHLVVKADKSVLKDLIDQATALDPEKYVDFSDVATALRNANTV